MSEFVYEPELLIRRLSGHGVRFVLVGGLAATIHGSPMVTADVDIAYERTRENHVRLAEALKSMNARLRGIEETVPFQLDAESLERGSNFTFETDLGNLDCLGWADGIRSYDELDVGALEVAIGDHTVRVASIDDLIAMKRASNRLKDREGVMHLEAVKEMTED